MAGIVKIATSVETLVVEARAAIKIARQGSNAPQPLEPPFRKLEETITQLELLQDIQQYASLSSCLEANVISSLQYNLDTSIAELESVKRNSRNLSTKYKSAKDRLAFLLAGKDETSYELQNLQRIQTTLSFALSTVTIAFRFLQLASMQKSEKDANSFHTSFWPQDSTAATAFSVDFRIPVLGRFAATLLKSKSTTNQLELALRSTLPFSQVLTFRTILSRSNWLDISLRSALRVHRVVDDGSLLHRACRSGELLEVRRLLLENPAAINDRTENNESLLQVAIQNRNCSIVRLLLDQCADVNESFGINGTSPLAWAIRTRDVETVRMLLKSKADCQHLGSYGWTPLFYLWWAPDNQCFVDQAETILQILASRDDFVDTYSGVIDTLEFSAIHMAVMRGTVSQVQFLLSLDPVLVHVKGFLGWTAIFVAVSAGRLDMLELLLPFYDTQNILQAKDTRGWTLLHTSATEGESDVTRHLLNLGADWQALSNPSLIEVPEQLKGCSCTPLEAASAESPAKRIRYLRDVKESCGEEVLSFEEVTELNKEWADAVW